MPKLLTSSAWQTLAVANPKLQRWRPWRAAVRRHIAEADRLLYAEIADRRADPKPNERTDALASMILAGAMTDSQLRDQLMTLLVAGHDTTATALSWALERLTRHPDVLRKAIRAAHAQRGGRSGGRRVPGRDRQGGAPDQARGLRRRSRLTAPTDVAGYQLPAGVMVAPGIGLVQRQRRVVPDPERFDPDRMIGATLGPTTWLPSGGATTALGATFALAELRIVLAGGVAPRGTRHDDRARRAATRQAVILVRIAGAASWSRRSMRWLRLRRQAKATAELPARPAAGPGAHRGATQSSPVHAPGVGGRDEVDHSHGIAFGPLVGCDELREHVRIPLRHRRAPR